MNIQVNQVLKHKNGVEYKVLEVLTQTALLKIEGFNSFWWTFDDIKKEFDLPKEKWKPKVGEKYFTVNFMNGVCVVSFSWSDDLVDKRLYERGFVCKTEAEAQALANKMLQAINE